MEGFHKVEPIRDPWYKVRSARPLKGVCYVSPIYTQYLPMVNPADQTLVGKSYKDEFWHAFFMSNHMNQTPDHFIRGRTLWHNEDRSSIKYKSAEDEPKAVNGTKFKDILNPRDFPAGFQLTSFHGNTCDFCHIRNGSGIPLMPNGQLSEIPVKERGMKPDFKINHDYTYSNKELPFMKMVLFDLDDEDSAGFDNCDNNDHTLPKPASLLSDQTVCGPADSNCKTQPENSDITEQEIKDMATYQSWIGIPNRSEYQVASKQVQQGEGIFKDLQCNSCHVIKKIAFDYDDNMLPDEERDHLKKVQIKSGNRPDYPFISYLGTDLLMHDMGYLSQVARAPENVKIRKEDGTVKEEYQAYVQHIRTPALKGLRLNRFVADSNHSTTSPLKKNPVKPVIQGCDFLMHDGRACDAIENPYLHDGPAIKQLGSIKALKELSEEQRKQLRAFLYSI